MEKILIKNNEAFVDWQKAHSDYLGNFEGCSYDEDSPKSYPCILIEKLEYNECSYCNLCYGFVYLTDFE